MQATVKAKTNYMLSKLDQMLGRRWPSGRAQPKPKAAEAKPPAPPTKPAPPQPLRPDRAASPRRDRPAKAPAEPPRDIVVVAPPTTATPTPPGPPCHPDEEGYTIDEIKAASAGLFGKVSANLGAVIEHLFRKSGRPTGYVLGTEGGGAFLAGVRYGEGTLYMRTEARRKFSGTALRLASMSAVQAPRPCS